MCLSFGFLCRFISQLEELLDHENLSGSKLPDQICVLDASLEGDDTRLIRNIRDRVSPVTESSNEVSEGLVLSLVQLIEIVLRSWALESTLEVGYELSLQHGP